MGNAPPTDYNLPPAKTETPTTTGMSDGPSSSDICNFKLPDLPDLTKLFSGFKAPSINLPELPNLTKALSIDCSSANPVKTDSPWGANRPSNVPDPASE